MKVKVLMMLAAICLCVSSASRAQTASFTHIGEKARIFDQVCSAAVLPSTADSMPLSDEVACGAYIEGLAEGMIARTQASSALSRSALEWPCFTPGITPQQLIGIVLGFLSEHPEMKDSPTGGVAAIAFMHRFPCG